MTAPRRPQSTVSHIEAHCEHFRDIFLDVRTFEHFQSLHVALLSDIPRKTLPAMADFLGYKNPQGLHNFLVTEKLSTARLRSQRLDLSRDALRGMPVTLMIDETGDRKKGTTTDYVSRQYLGSIGKIDNGLVSVHLVAFVKGITIPLLFRVFKPEKRLREGDVHRSKIALAIEMMNEIAKWEMNVELVVADSLYGMAGNFVRSVQKKGWPYALAIRSDFSMLLPKDEDVQARPWKSVTRHFNDGTQQSRWAQEFIWGRERDERYVLMTTDRESQPKNETSFVRMRLEGDDVIERLPDAYGVRTWVEAAFRGFKTDLGWHHYRLTRWEYIERWYEVILSVYTMVSLEALRREDDVDDTEETPLEEAEDIESKNEELTPPKWRGSKGWINTLRDFQSWVRPLGAMLTLLSWSSYLNIDEQPLLILMQAFYAMPFP